MNWQGKDGIAKRDHLEIAASGMIPNKEAAALLNSEPPFPISTADMWALFLDLHGRRKRDDNGPLRFAWTDLHSYSEVTGARFDPFVLRFMFALEDAYFEVLRDHKDK